MFVDKRTVWFLGLDKKWHFIDSVAEVSGKVFEVNAHCGLTIKPDEIPREGTRSEHLPPGPVCCGTTRMMAERKFSDNYVSG